MKRLFAILAAIVVLGALLVSAPALLISTDAARERIETQLSAWFGARVRVGAPPRLSVLPRLSLGLDDVSLEGRGWSLTGARLTARLDLSELLGGSTRLASLVIDTPAIRVAAPSAERPQAAIAAGRALQRILRHPLTISNASVHVGEAQEPLLRDMNLRLAASGDGASVRGAFLFDDQPVEATLALSNTAVLAGEGAGSATATLNAPLASLRIEGMVGEGGAPRLSGSFSASTSDLRGLMRRFGHVLIGDAAFGVAGVSGTGSISLSALELDAARVELDGNIGEGRLALADGSLRPRLEGTLAFERLDLSAYLEELRGFARKEAAGPEWARAPLFRLLTVADIDLRLSAASLVAGGLETDASAMSLLLRDGDLSVNLSETRLAGGTGALTVRARPEAEKGYAAAATVIAEDLDLAELSLPEDGPQIAGGRADGRLDVTARAATLAQLGERYSAILTVDAGDVRVGTVDLDAMMGGLLAGEAGSAPASGSRFDAVSARLQIDAERLRVDAFEATTPRHRLELAGGIARADAGLAMRGTLSERRADAADASALPVRTMPVLLRGTLTAPRLLPDMTRLDAPKNAR